MQKIITFRNFIIDDRAISEEFTTLPALSIVMIGFALFFVLFAQTCLTYENNIARLQNYQTAETITKKLTNPESYFIRDGHIVDLTILQNNPEPLQKIREQYEKSGISFLLRLHGSNTTWDYPEELTNTVPNRVSVFHYISIYLNEAQTIPGSLAIIVWRDS